MFVKWRRTLNNSKSSCPSSQTLCVSYGTLYRYQKCFQSISVNCMCIVTYIVQDRWHIPNLYCAVLASTCYKIAAKPGRTKGKSNISLKSPFKLVF